MPRPSRARAKPARWLIAVSLLAHLALGVGIFVSGIWRIEQLPRGRMGKLSAVMAMPEPAAGGQMQSRSDVKLDPKKPAKPIPKELTQPERNKKPPEEPVATAGDGTTVGPGIGPGDKASTGDCLDNCGDIPAAPVCGDGARTLDEQCDDGNTASDDGCSASCRLELPPPPPQPKLVAPNVLAGLRVSGDIQPRPSASTVNQMMRDDTRKVTATIEVCVGTDGSVTSTKVRSSTKYPDYDREILSTVRDWHYRPYLINDRPVPVCTHVMFIYTLR